MKSENHAWDCLGDHAASLLSAGFAERAVRASRTAACTPMGQFFLSATTATLCAAAVMLFFAQTARIENSRNLAGWQEIASANDDLTPGQ
jgi:hypothetical protein